MPRTERQHDRRPVEAGEALEQLPARLVPVDRNPFSARDDNRAEPVQRDRRVHRRVADGVDDPVELPVELPAVGVRRRRDRQPEQLLVEPPEAAQWAEAVRLRARRVDRLGPVDADAEVGLPEAERVARDVHDHRGGGERGRLLFELLRGLLRGLAADVDARDRLTGRQRVRRSGVDLSDDDRSDTKDDHDEGHEPPDHPVACLPLSPRSPRCDLRVLLGDIYLHSAANSSERTSRHPS